MRTVGMDTGIGPQREGPGVGGVLFEPRIVGFLCRWCSYPGADLAGTSRLAYSPALRVIQIQNFKQVIRQRQCPMASSHVNLTSRRYAIPRW